MDLSPLNDTCLLTLSKYCTKLTKIYLNGDCTDTGVSAIYTTCIHITEINMEICKNITDNSILTLASNYTLARYNNHNNMKLQKLSLSYNNYISDISMCILFKTYMRLTSVNIRYCPLITDTTIITLFKHCHTITHITLANTTPTILQPNPPTGITDNGIIASLSYLTHIRELSLEYINIYDETISVISRYCLHINKVHLISCKNITERSVIALIRNSKRIKNISLERCSVKISWKLKKLLKIDNNDMNTNIFSTGNTVRRGLSIALGEGRHYQL